MTPSPRAARPAFVEALEDRRLFAAFVFSDVSRLIFNDPAGGAASAGRAVTLRNTGNTALTIPAGGVTIGGANPAQFAVAPVTRSTTVAAGGTLKLTVSFAPTTVGVKAAALVVRSNAANAPTFNVTLRGLGTAGLQGSNEPSLQRILDTYQIPVNVGDNNPAEPTIPIPAAAGSQRVDAEMFRKAGAGNVTLTPIAVFSNEASPGAIAGWYTSAGTGAVSKRQLFTVPAADVQTLNPRITGTTAFDPGSAAFGLYSTWPAQGNRTVFSEIYRNTFISPASKQRMFASYPLRNPDGTVVPNAYVVGNEEAFNNDLQDAVFIIRNVVPAAAGSAAEPTTPVGAAVFQAESATMVGATVKSTANAGYTGSGYADFTNNAGDGVRWAVSRSTAGLATVTFRYANGSAADRPLELRVNGVVVRPSVSMAATGSWTTWKTVSLTVSLAAGANTIQLTTIGYNGPNLDSMTVA